MNWARLGNTAPAAKPSLRKSQHAGALLAILTCPCHAVPLVFLLSGTAAGAWLSQHFPVLVGALAGAFLFSLWLLFWPAWKKRNDTCSTCSTDTQRRFRDDQ